jgi:hypothetical protein
LCLVSLRKIKRRLDLDPHQLGFNLLYLWFMVMRSVAAVLGLALMPAPLSLIHGEAFLRLALLPQSQLFLAAIKFLAGC